MSEFFDIVVRFVPESSRVTTDPVGADSDNWLELSQKDDDVKTVTSFKEWFAANHGDWSKYNFGDSLEFWENFRSLCEEDGSYTATIRVHRSSSDLGYRLDATKGDWLYEDPVVQTEQDTKRIGINKASSYTFRGENVVSIVCAHWEGNVYDENNVLLGRKPDIVPETVTDAQGRTTTTLQFGPGQIVTGRIRAVVVLEFDEWYLEIDPQQTTGDSVEVSGLVSAPGDDPETSDEGDGGYGAPECTEAYDEGEADSIYGSTVYAVYSEGIEELEVRVPDLEGNCGGGGGGGGDDPDEPEPECYKLKIVYHKCTGEEESRNLTRVPCPE